MFEDFKEKVGKLQNKLDSEIPSMSNASAPEIIEKLSKAGIDPDSHAATIYSKVRWRRQRFILNVRR